MRDFVNRLKKQMLDEFRRQDRRGVYGFMQKIIAYNSNKIEGRLSRFNSFTENMVISKLSEKCIENLFGYTDRFLFCNIFE